MLASIPVRRFFKRLAQNEINRPADEFLRLTCHLEQFRSRDPSASLEGRQQIHVARFGNCATCRRAKDIQSLNAVFFAQRAQSRPKLSQRERWRVGCHERRLGAAGGDGKLRLRELTPEGAADAREVSVGKDASRCKLANRRAMSRALCSSRGVPRAPRN